MKQLRRRCERGEKLNEDCEIVSTFWCSLCRSHIILDSGASHAIASRKQILMEGSALHPWCRIHRRFALSRERLAAGVKVCPVCRAEFRPKRSSALYCSSRCRQKASRLGGGTIEKRMKSDSFMKRCQEPRCRQTLAGRSLRAKYCSSTCRSLARYHRERGRVVA